MALLIFVLDSLVRETDRIERKIKTQNPHLSRSASPPGSAGSGSGTLKMPGRSPTKNTNAGANQTMLKRKPKTYRSVITDIFDGKLNSSVQCLTCDRVSTTTESFQDLSLPIPSQVQRFLNISVFNCIYYSHPYKPL